MDAVPILAFYVGEQAYALRINDVLEVAAMVELLPMPQSAPEVLGLANRHGEVLPLLDMRLVMGVPQQLVTANTFFVVVEYEEQRLGLVVDQIDLVKYFPTQAFQRVPSNVYVQTIVNDGGNILQILEVEPLFNRVMPRIEA
jgi:chemotaxis signal transduction protein